MQFDFKIENKILSQNGEISPVICDNSDYSVHFTFDGEWEGVTKTVRFTNGKNYVDVILPNNNTVLIPREILSPPAVNIGVYAPAVRTTAPAKIPCRNSILTSNGTPAEPVDDVYTQLLSRYDELKNEQTELYENMAQITENEQERIRSEEERKTSEIERKALAQELSEHSVNYANSYRMRIVNSDGIASVITENALVGTAPLYIKLFGSVQENVPSEGKSPETPSSFSFYRPSRMLFGSKNITFNQNSILYSLGDGITDAYDIVSGQFVHNVGVAKFKKLNGKLYLFDEVSGEYGNIPYEVSYDAANSTVTNVLYDSSEMYPRGKKGTSALCTHFIKCASVSECTDGCYYDGGNMYFAYGEEKLDEAEAKELFYSLIEREIENGTDITVYYEYSEPFLTENISYDLIFSEANIVINSRRVPFEMLYNCDTILVIDSLKNDIEELKTQLTLLAEGGEA